MEIKVSGRHIEIGDAFKQHVTTRLAAITERYFSRAMSSAVTLGKDSGGTGFHVDCTMHVRQGVVLKAEAGGVDANAAFDAAADRIDKQLRRYKRRLKNHHNDSVKELEVAQAAYTVLHNDHETEAHEDRDNPIVIAETATEIPSVCVSDAVMLMDLRHAPALMFRDVRTGHLAMVYRRADGNIGWVDPARA